MYADLHVHSLYSDGVNSPEELFALAGGQGLSVIAISDHDTVDGVRAAQAVDRGGVRLIPALEVSVVSAHRFLHILGYHVDIESAALAAYIDEAAREKTENTRLNFERGLSVGSFLYPWGRVLELNAGQRRLSGVHVARAMEDDGYQPPDMTRKELFWKHFRPESQFFLHTEKATVADAIAVVKAAGGVPVIAHPKLVYDDGVVLEMIRLGAQGIEAHYPLHTPAETEKYLRIARERGILVTGGSDWHGDASHEAERIGACGLEHGDYEILNWRLAQ